MKSLYVPISCSYYDRLEAWAVRKERVHIRYSSPEDEQEVVDVSGIIADLYSKNNAEYLELDTGQRIRLDYLVSVNNIDIPTSNACER